MARDLFGRNRRGPFDERNRDNNPEEIRVTDRRRIHVEDGDADSLPGDLDESPILKPSYVEELEARVRAAEQKTLEVNSRFEQLRAQLQKETDETRQRLNKAADERARREKADFIAALLPVLDNLQRATEAAESGSSPEIIAEGIRQTAASFEKALAAAGVEPINAVGEQFDPEFHEGVETVEVAPDDEGRVIAQHAPGYRMGERLLRPARVKVGRPAAMGKQAGD
ncbi:MAG TPA: nucleotide exchange factor GrpE [Pyrinomonadaceae bacterium]|nr:nucleotide exchange factor GrpE [Pyrinomonadaceae bacterium]